MIEVTNLTKDFGMRRAVDDLTFDAGRGEILGFLGPNGAGKTTTMRILCGYVPPTSGSVKVGGYDVIENSLEVRQLVGYLPETIPLYPDMTVYAYLEFMAQLRKVKNIQNRIDDVLEMVGMEERADGYVGNLSKGMRQRIGLAQALLHQPEVLILDEPTIGLDPAQIIEVRKLIQDIGKQHTVLLSTHILSEAQQICNRVLIINKGRIVTEDTPENLQARLSGSQKVTIRVRKDADAAAAMITRLPGVISTRILPDESIAYESNPNQDIRPEIARAVINAGFDLLELTPENLSLEDIFLQLTRDEPPHPDFQATSAELLEKN
jgi:ABC-2 type transport system ATP-binding protein